MSNRTIILCAGPAYVGKGTQAKEIGKQYDLPVISSGQVLRNIVNAANRTREGTQEKDDGNYLNLIDHNYELADLLSRSMREGDLVPSSSVMDIMHRRLDWPDCSNGVVLDGFARKLKEARMFDNILAEHGDTVKAFVVFNATDAKLLDNFNKRLEYNRAHGLPIREDDTPENAQKRIDLQRMHLRHTTRYFNEQGKVVNIDSNGEREDVTVDTLETMEEVMRPQHKATTQIDSVLAQKAGELHTFLSPQPRSLIAAHSPVQPEHFANRGRRSEKAQTPHHPKGDIQGKFNFSR